MSAACHLSATIQPPFHVYISQTLPKEQQTTVHSLLSLLPSEYIGDVQLDAEVTANLSTVVIKNMVDGRGLACPMPLLKTKVALRDVAVGESLYVVATDPNSQADIMAFCQQSQHSSTATPLLLWVNQSTSKTLAAAPFDTIFHFIITKTDSN